MSGIPYPVAFAQAFHALTGNSPFPWQGNLFDRFATEDIPTCCDLPTGLGKTSVIAVWLIALAACPDRIPRRLVYVVNRRTVVDQTTTEVEKFRRNLEAAGLKEPLAKLCALPTDSPLAISTLRGQFADNREWSTDPCRPAVIVGTVDMMGSRLLFGGYGIGFKTRPLHAGFLGQDTLIVHDEAHLEPAFQDLLTAIESEQKRCREQSPSSEPRKVQIMELSATPHSVGDPFRISSADEEHPVVKARLGATKRLTLHPAEDAAEVPAQIIELAQRHKDSGLAVLVFANGVKDVEQIAAALEKELGKDKKKNVERLTGTMRGKERDQLVKRAAFVRFLQSDDVAPDAETAAEGTVYLVCTSAGEVGVNISADHLVCDLSTFDSMAQRFGRVNRFGAQEDSEVVVVHPTKFDEKSERDQRREKTLALLQRLGGNANANAIRTLVRSISDEERCEAFAPQPKTLPTSDILFDAWSLTTITGSFPGRPALAEYLHGKEENELPETRIAWRDDVWELRNIIPFSADVPKSPMLRSERNDSLSPEAFLADYPLKPHELLRDQTSRVAESLAKLVARQPERAKWPMWLIDLEGEIEVLPLRVLTEKTAKELIANRTVLLLPKLGGLNGGLLDHTSDEADDIADEWPTGQNRHRIREWEGNEKFTEQTAKMRRIRRIDTDPLADEQGEEEGQNFSRRFWLWFELPRFADSEGSRFANREILLEHHAKGVESRARVFAEKSRLAPELTEAVALAGRFHDLGKHRPVWQQSIGNFDPNRVLAKSGRKSIPPQLRTDYRHEFGSVLDLESAPEFQRLSPEMKDIVLHLVAAHHGRARPHFPADEIFDSQHPHERAAALAAEAPRRFARLQRKYGRWHLAWLESLLRAADYAASADTSTTTEEQP